MRKETLTIIMCFMLGCLATSWALTVPAVKTRKQKTPTNQRVNLRHADTLYYNQMVNPMARILVGKVSLEHAGTELTCDSALFYEASNSFDAFGNVKMRRGDTLTLDCDILYYNGTRELAQARKNVVLVHHKNTLLTDTLDYDMLNDVGYYQNGGKLKDDKNLLVSDWGMYDMLTHDASFYYNVELNSPAVNPKTTLKTDSLHYNTSTGIARLVSLSNIMHGKDSIFTRRGVYNTKTEKAYLIGRSVVVSGNRRLVGDSIDYDGRTKLAKCYGNVRSQDRSGASYMDCDSVVYDDRTKVTTGYGGVTYIDKKQQREITCLRSTNNDQTKVTEGWGDVVMVDKKNKRHMTCDYVRTDDVKKESHAFGHVVMDDYLNHRRLVCDTAYNNDKTQQMRVDGHVTYVDSLNKNMFTGHYAFYDDAVGYAETADSALLMDYSQRDTLYAHADSFRVYTYHIDTDSMYRTLHAYRHVRAFRKDVQAVCDSMVYVSKDSCATMYYDPIVWQNNQQILGEFIHIWVNDSTIDSVYVVNQALTVERIDSIHYNQLACKELRNYFKGKDIDHTVAHQNVRLNYYPFDDDSLMIGMNHLETTQLRMYMVNRKLERIWGAASTGTLYPLGLVPPDQLYLDNFQWFEYIRPSYPMDVFNWRGKKDETKLRPSATHKPPRQTLSKVNSE